MPPVDGSGAGPPGPPHAGPSRWRIPFWAFQILELGVAFLLVTQSIHVVRGGLLVVAGVLLAVLALTARGPVGLLRVCGQRLHLALVVVLAVAMGAAAVVPASRPDADGVLMIAFAFVVLIFFTTRTAVDSRGIGRRRGRRTATPGPVIDTTATIVVPADDQPPGPARPADGSDSALRRVGRTTGAATAAGRRAVDEHRPAVEDQIKRTLRGAGRLAGRLSGPAAPAAAPPAAPAAAPPAVPTAEPPADTRT
ncbi:MAG: hypothetical protein ABSF84_12390 [Acidimicrobiales bacterium]|jgi:hypothetical protein